MYVWLIWFSHLRRLGGLRSFYFRGVAFSTAYCGLVDTPGGEPAFEFLWALIELAGLDGRNEATALGILPFLFGTLLS